MSRLIDKWPAPKEVKPMRVLCLGFGRTGTGSLTEALRILGYSPYHLLQTLDRPQEFPLLTECAEANLLHKGGKPWGRAELDKFLGPYDCVVDAPWNLMAEDLSTLYPGAKVIVTHRDIDEWEASLARAPGVVMSWWTWPLVTPFDGVFAGPWFKFLNTLVQVTHVPGRPPLESIRAYYEGHVPRVHSIVGSERILDYNVKQGWGPLCEFLGHDVPKEPFPHINDAAFFVEAHAAKWWIAFRKMALTLSALAVVPAAVGYMWVQNRHRLS